MIFASHLCLVGHLSKGICIQWTGVLDLSAGMEYWNGITGME